MVTENRIEPTGVRSSATAIAIGAWGAFVAGLGLGALGRAVNVDDVGAVTDSLSGAVDAWRSTVLNPAYWVFLGALIVAQWRWPARRELRGLSVGLAEDLVWYLTSTALAISVVAGYLTLLEQGYVHAFGGWSLDLEPKLGSWGLPIVALAITDLIAWWSHYLHHKIPALWAFHAVHHSQEEMNVLSDSRQHLVETMITATLVFVPARILGLDAPAASALTFLSIYVGAFIHANIRTNLGAGRYLLISPQAHRVHHSSDPAHFNTNFGVILACWDYVFATRYHDDDAYPTTGIDDRAFPLERRADPLALMATWIRQTAYPFQMLLHNASVDAT